VIARGECVVQFFFANFNLWPFAAVSDDGFRATPKGVEAKDLSKDVRVLEFFAWTKR
jgi:hypothetical protein